MKWNKVPGYNVFLLSMLALLLSGCVAGQKPFKQGNQALMEENYDQAVMEYLDAVEKDPNKSEYRLKLNQARSLSALDHMSLADELFEKEQFQKSLQEYSIAFDLDGSLYAAKDGLERSRDHLQVLKMIAEAEVLLTSNRQLQAQELIAAALAKIPDHEQALKLKSKVKQSRFALVDGVELDVISTEPIDLNFNKTKLPNVFKILTKLSGINFIIDEDVRDAPTTLSLEQATFAQALELLLRMNKLDKKILNSKTIILYPKTREKKKQFDDQVIQTFYLSHFDAKKAVNMLRTMLQVRKVFVQEDLNAIVIRDHPDVIRLAQKLIEANDRGNSEVVFDLELIEINHSDTRELGLKLSNYSGGAGLSLHDSGFILDTSVGSGTGNLVPFTSDINPFKFNDTLDSFYSLPTATFRFMKSLVDAEVLASPKIRVKNKEKAKVHVGSREPVITTTINDGTTVTNVQYIDVGVKLDVEPQIQLDNTIITKLGLEVSNVTGTISSGSTTAIIISSTNANTTLTLKDGEQTIIGGLIRSDNSTTKNKIPLLGDIPLLGEAFNGTDKTKSKREILLSVTPHIVKSVHVPMGDLASIWSGGEDDLKFGRNFGTFVQDYQAGQDTLNPEKVLPVPVKNEIEVEQDQVAEANKTERADTIKPPVAPEVTPNSITEEIVKPQPILMSNPMLFIDGPRESKVGDEIEVEVFIERVEGLINAPLVLSYDPAMLQFIDAIKGSFMSGTLGNVKLTQNDDPERGHIVLDLNLPAGSSGASGNGKLYRLRFKALEAGEVQINPVKVSFGNAEGTELKMNSFGFVSVIKP